MQTKIDRIHALVPAIIYYNYRYYVDSAPDISDQQYDSLLDELTALEKETGVILANSPTQTVGHPVVQSLGTVSHPIPLLSLNKTKLVDELESFRGGRLATLSIKVDGLTVKLEYDVGVIQKASTRGDGNAGQDVSHNVGSIAGIPRTIPFMGKLIVVGEVYIHKADFEYLRQALTDTSGKRPKTARNLASGSIQAFDSKVTAGRRLHFIPFNVQSGFDGLNSKAAKNDKLAALGFKSIPRISIEGAANETLVQQCIDELTAAANTADIPIDGMVLTFDDIEFSKSLGRTGRYYNDGLAFKYQDDKVETTLLDVEWNTCRSGEISPTAILETVEIDGTDVSRATLCNLTFIKEKNLRLGCAVLVSKRGQIIPCLEENLEPDGPLMDFPATSPCCGKPTQIMVGKSKDGRSVEKLYCGNPLCKDRYIRGLVHFTGEKAFDMEGISTATLERLVEAGCVGSPIGLFHISDQREKIIDLDGFGEKSYQKMLEVIEDRRKITFERFLISMDIPLIGRHVSKTISDYFCADVDDFEKAVIERFDFMQLPDIGEKLNSNIYEFFCKLDENGQLVAHEENWKLWHDLKNEVTFVFHMDDAPVHEAPPAEGPFVGKTVVVSGTLQNYTRTTIETRLLSLGAKFGKKVTSNTDYLLIGDKPKSKLQQAKDLGVKVINEDDFLIMIGELK